MNWHNVLLRPRNLYEELLRRKLISGGGVPAVLQTVTGISPLTLLNVASKGIKSLTQFGKCEQGSTPTPSVPVDIRCNNGALRMVHRSGLPSGYKLLEYVGGSGSQYIITDVYLASTDVIECEYRNSSTTGYGAVYGIYKTGESSALYGNQTYYGYDESNNKVDTDVRVDTEWHSSRHDFVNGTLTIDDTTVTFTPFEFVNSTKNAVLSRYYNSSYGYNWKGYVRKFKVTRGNEVICDLLPAKNSSNVTGLYDLISGNFYTATGGTLLEGNEVDDYEFYADGTDEVLTVASETTQTASVENLFGVGDYKDTQDIISGAVMRRCGVIVLDGTENWTLTSSGSGVAVFSIEANAHAIQGWSEITSLCTHFGCYVGDVFPTYIAANVGKFWLNTSGQYFRFVTNGTMDLAQFKAWLAEQYANGTPVVIVYPLAEPTTEQVTAQHLKARDTATITAVTENISDITLEVQYWEKAE